MKLQNKITVGSIESGDIMITLEPSVTADIAIILESNFIKQYGKEIKTIIRDELQSNAITHVKVVVVDQGAIPAVIKARLRTAINRAQGQQFFNFIKGEEDEKS